METEAAKMEEISSMNASDFVYEAIRGAGKVGGYLHNVLTDAIYYTGKYVAYVRSLCPCLKASLYGERGAEGEITMMHLVRSDSVIDEADKKEFYLNFGRDMVELTKSGLEGENLTIIDLSKYSV